MPAVRYPPDETGFFYILSRPKPEYTQDYHEWYNTEHGPLRVQLDFVMNGYRYQCMGPETDVYLATYDLSRLSGLDEAQYTCLRDHRSPRESAVFSHKLDWLDRRIYADISSRGKATGPAPVLMIVSLLVRDDLVHEVHQWYEEEHIYDLSRIPGWRRTRRFQLVEADDMQAGYTEVIAVHEFDKANGLDGPEHKLAKSRAWRNRIMREVVERRENHRFEFFHEFKASDYRRP